LKWCFKNLWRANTQGNIIILGSRLHRFLMKLMLRTPQASRIFLEGVCMKKTPEIHLILKQMVAVQHDFLKKNCNNDTVSIYINFLSLMVVLVYTVLFLEEH